MEKRWKEIDVRIAKVAKARLVDRATFNSEKSLGSKKPELGLELNKLARECLPMKPELREFVHPSVPGCESTRLHIEVPPEVYKLLEKEEKERYDSCNPRHSIPRIIEDIIMLEYTVLYYPNEGAT